MVSCKKDDKSSINNSQLTGSWKLVLITGGIGGIHETAAQWGHTESYIFKPDATFTHTVDSTTTNFAAYTLTSDAIHHSDGLSVGGQYLFNVDFTHDTLLVWNIGISDYTTNWYVRQ